VNRELHVVAGVSIFLTHPGLWINSQRAGKTLRAKAIVREEKRVRFSARFSYFSFVFARTVDLAPNVGFRRSWYRWKACATRFLKVSDLQTTELGLERYGPVDIGGKLITTLTSLERVFFFFLDPDPHLESVCDLFISLSFEI
jgi:hypothetical protein